AGVFGGDPGGHDDAVHGLVAGSGSGDGAGAELGVDERGDLVVGEAVGWIGGGDQGRAAQGAVPAAAVLGEAGQVAAGHEGAYRVGGRGGGVPPRGPVVEG